jgi:hypothetical protein
VTTPPLPPSAASAASAAGHAGGGPAGPPIRSAFPPLPGLGATLGHPSSSGSSSGGVQLRPKGLIHRGIPRGEAGLPRAGGMLRNADQGGLSNAVQLQPMRSRQQRVMTPVPQVSTEAEAMPEDHDCA